MSVTILQLTPRDPIIARDGRPFGAGQGNRMRGLTWPLPSVVAGSFRTALVKANPSLDFASDMPQRLMAVEVAGVFPAVENELYLPAPYDCVWNGDTGEIHAAKPFPIDQGSSDFPIDGLRPVMYSDDPKKPDFKPKRLPAWWPVGKLIDWLLGKPLTFDASFLDTGVQETRDHVCLDADTGAAAEGQIFATAGLNVTHLPRYGINREDKKLPFDKRFEMITLSARVTLAEKAFEHVEKTEDLAPARRRTAARPLATKRCGRVVDVPGRREVRSRNRHADSAGAGHAGGLRRWVEAGLVEQSTPRDTARNEHQVETRRGQHCPLEGRFRLVAGEAQRQRRTRPKGRPGPKAIRRMVPAGSLLLRESRRRRPHSGNERLAQAGQRCSARSQ